MRRLVVATALALALAATASGQAGYNLDWWTTSPGPAMGGGGQYALRGAAGQPTVAFMSGNTLDARGGYYQRATVWWELRLPIVRRR